MGVFGSHGVLVAMFLCSGLVGAAAQEPPSLVNDLEYKIEVGRHEQLLTVQRSTASSLAPFTSDGCSGGLSSSWIMISSLFPVLAKRHGEARRGKVAVLPMIAPITKVVCRTVMLSPASKCAVPPTTSCGRASSKSATTACNF